MKNISIQSNLPPPETSATQKWWALLGVGLGLLMFTLDSSIVNLPDLIDKIFGEFACLKLENKLPKLLKTPRLPMPF